MIPTWLDPATAALVDDLVQTLASKVPDLLDAILLYGSISRHDERPLSDPEPSDVDLLAIFATEDRSLFYQGKISFSLEPAYCRHLDAPRDVNFMFVTRTMRECDPLYIENVARDGIVLYQRKPLPACLELSLRRQAS